MAHPSVLLDLVEEYQALEMLNATDGGPEAQQRLDDVSYTLCVATGTRRVEDALAAARKRLGEARTGTDGAPRAAEAGRDLNTAFFAKESDR